MKKRFRLCFLVAMFFLVSSTIVWAQSNSSTNFKTPSNDYEYEIKTLIDNAVQDKVEEAHNKILKEFNFNKNDWV
ncbi:hypothetical protein [Desulfitibacter alkalitolerans]|uniref:hypothetical protein n=1 Tax=Desulfitibacter alkalitolerans TaxID=264641 RepID=UPI000485F161|nr:hypothetical protein [Desulfitibacter alkalitolerans]